MITIDEVIDGRDCNCCHAKGNIKEINFEYVANHQGTSIALCEKCMNEFAESLKANGVLDSGKAKVMDFSDVYLLNSEFYFLELRGDIAVRAVLPDRYNRVALADYFNGGRTVFIGENRTYVVKSSEYGWHWRCWTGRPTEEQRQAELWKNGERE